MTNKIIFILLLVFSATYLSAASYVPSSYLTNDGEVQEGLVKVPTDIFGKPMLQYLQNHVEFVNREDKVTMLKANEIKQFRFNMEGQTYLYHSFVNQLKPKVFWKEEDKIFMQVVEQGELTLLIGYNNTVASGGSVSIAVKEFFLYKKGEFLTEVSGLTFRKTMANYFADCPKLAEKIINKKLKKKDLPEIVLTYNLLTSQ